MKHTFTPKLCDGKEYEGTLTLRMPSAVERMEMIDDMSDEVKDMSSEDAIKQELASSRKHVSVMRKAIGLVVNHFVSSTITRKSDGFVFDTYEKLNYDSDMLVVLQEAAGKIIGKYSVTDPS